VSPVARFVRLPPRRRLLVLRAAVAVTGFRLGLAVLPFGRVRTLAARRGPARKPRASVQDLAWSVTAAGRVLRSTCLADALALQYLLVREGYPAGLRIGVAKTPAGDLEAHAWLESGGRVLIGGPQSARFTALPLPDGPSTPA
jgi:hypothetical protein